MCLIFSQRAPGQLFQPASLHGVGNDLVDSAVKALVRGCEFEEPYEPILEMERREHDISESQINQLVLEARATVTALAGMTGFNMVATVVFAVLLSVGFTTTGLVIVGA
ncbi:MAG: hypothetical protein P8Y83_04310, partial [Gammaproteobacteria bacterium]